MELIKNIETIRIKQNLNKYVGYRNYETAFPISILGEEIALAHLANKKQKC